MNKVVLGAIFATFFLFAQNVDAKPPKSTLGDGSIIVAEGFSAPNDFPIAKWARTIGHYKGYVKPASRDMDEEASVRHDGQHEYCNDPIPHTSCKVPYHVPLRHDGQLENCNVQILGFIAKNKLQADNVKPSVTSPSTII